MLIEYTPGRMTRALLTDGERTAVEDDPDMDDNTKSSHLTRVRRKTVRMKEDARLLREHRPELYDDLRAAVVEQDMDERIERLEQEMEVLRDQVQVDEPNDNS
jgi:hypothetical protein